MGETFLLISCLVGCFVVGWILGTDFGKNRMAKIAADEAVQSDAFKRAVKQAYQRGGLDALALVASRMNATESNEEDDSNDKDQ